jgi:hypothetical protein
MMMLETKKTTIHSAGGTSSHPHSRVRVALRRRPRFPVPVSSAVAIRRP